MQVIATSAGAMVTADPFASFTTAHMTVLVVALQAAPATYDGESAVVAS